MNFDHHLIDRDPFRESVIRMLEEAIIKLELKPGDRLVETKISETFGVSRGPVREAILDLEARGLVERTPFKGAVVSTLTKNDIDELKSCRMDVETLAIKIIFASNKDINGVVEKLQSMMQEMVNAAHQNNLPEFLALDYQFHDELIHQAANSLLEEMWKPVSVRLRRYFFLNSRHGYIPLEEAVKQHQAIIDAITAGDANKTSELLRAHYCWS